MCNLDFLKDIHAKKIWNLMDCKLEVKKLIDMEISNAYTNYSKEFFLRKAVLLIGFEYDDVVYKQVSNYKCVDKLFNDYAYQTSSEETKKLMLKAATNDEALGEVDIKVIPIEVGSQYIITEPFDIYGSPYINIDSVLDKDFENAIEMAKETIVSQMENAFYKYVKEKDFILHKIAKEGLEFPKFTMQLWFLNNNQEPVDIFINPMYSLEKTKQLPKLEDISFSPLDKMDIRFYGNRSMARCVMSDKKYKPLLDNINDKANKERKSYIWDLDGSIKETEESTNIKVPKCIYKGKKFNIGII